MHLPKEVTVLSDEEVGLRNFQAKLVFNTVCHFVDEHIGDLGLNCDVYEKYPYQYTEYVPYANLKVYHKEWCSKNFNMFSVESSAIDMAYCINTYLNFPMMWFKINGTKIEGHVRSNIIELCDLVRKNV